MKNTIQQLHIASQYLAAAGINFVTKEADDSHTNLAWNSANDRMETHSFGSGNYQLAINLTTTHLEWLKEGESTNSIDLQGNTHSDIVSWISEQVSKSGIEKQYEYKFHYDLPYSKIENDSRFKFSTDELNKIIARLNTGQESFEAFLKENHLKSPIRIWPHHFDLGIYTSINSEGTFFMGAGLAIPDSLVDDLYYYASGYDNGKPVVTKNYSGLSNGEWRTDWNGATLASTEIDSTTGTKFLDEVRKGFLKGND